MHKAIINKEFFFTLSKMESTEEANNQLTAEVESLRKQLRRYSELLGILIVSVCR